MRAGLVEPGLFLFLLVSVRWVKPAGLSKHAFIACGAQRGPETSNALAPAAGRQLAGRGRAVARGGGPRARILRAQPREPNSIQTQSPNLELKKEKKERN